MWAIIAGQALRTTSFHGIESLVRSTVRRNLGLNARFGDDTLGYFTERLEPGPTRSALAGLLRRAKRNKAFEGSARIGLAVDGTTVGRCQDKRCELCRPYRASNKKIAGYRHHLVMISVVGAGLSLPFDAEPYGPNDSEYAAGQRLLRRGVAALGPRFADYLTVDAGFSTSAFLHTADKLGIPVIARLKGNLRELSAAAERRFGGQSPHRVLQEGADCVELWDAGDFDPWQTLDWKTVRVLRYHEEHRHSGIALLTPAMVQSGQTEAILAQRQAVLSAAYQAHPERFVRRPPAPLPLPSAVWINKPAPAKNEPETEPETH